VPRHTAYGFQDAFVGDITPPELALNHCLPLSRKQILDVHFDVL
jgi:hypothetical protein